MRRWLASRDFARSSLGGTLPGISAKSSARLDLTSSQALVMYGDEAETRIEYRKIESIEYGENVSRR